MKILERTTEFENSELSEFIASNREGIENLDDLYYFITKPVRKFKNANGKVKIHNRIYEQRIYNYMSSLIETSTDLGYYNEKSKFINENGDLDLKKVLIKFSEFMKHEYSKKREAFLEADGRLL